MVIEGLSTLLEAGALLAGEEVGVAAFLLIPVYSSTLVALRVRSKCRLVLQRQLLPRALHCNRSFCGGPIGKPNNVHQVVAGDVVTS